MLLFVFVLLVLPCYSLASWGGLFGVKGATQSSVEERKDSLKALSQELSAVESTNPSETVKTVNFQDLLNKSTKLETVYTESQKELESYRDELKEISTLCETLKAQLETYVQTDAISEEEYNQVLGVLQTVTATNTDYENAIIDRDKEIAKLKRKAGFAPYVKINALATFDKMIPSWYVGASTGLKFGSGALIEIGANYKIGKGKDFFKVVEPLALDNFAFNVSVGWIF